MSLRDTTVARALELPGLSYGNGAKKAAFLAHQYPFDPPFHANQMGAGQSGCLLTYRSLLALQRRASGEWEIPGEIDWHGRRIDALREPYSGPTLGKIEGLLKEFARQRGALRERSWDSEDPPVLLPGDLQVIGNLGQAPPAGPERDRWLAEWGGVAHGLCVTGEPRRLEGEGEVWAVPSVDGGQGDALNSGYPTAIEARERRLVRRANGWWLEDSPGGKARRMNWRLDLGAIPCAPP